MTTRLALPSTKAARAMDAPVAAASALPVIEIASLIICDEPVILVNVKMKACHGQTSGARR
jgi:hypothetical protein